MNINRFDAHDRLTFVKKKGEADVFKGADDCLKVNKLSLALQEKSPYVYLYAHPRTQENGDKHLFWQPRLSKPKCTLNSYLFRAQSKTDLIEVCWLLPPREQWSSFNKNSMFADELIQWSIDQYVNNKAALEAPEPEDVEDAKGHQIMIAIIEEMQRDKTLGQWFNPDHLPYVKV
jgi:hypothetical protein